MLSPHHPLQLVLGLIIWSLFFVVIYAGVSLGCTFSTPSPDQGALTWINFSVLLLMLLTMLILLGSAYHCWRGRISLGTTTQQDRPQQARSFIAGVAASEYVLAAIATLVVGLPAVYLPPCI